MTVTSEPAIASAASVFDAHLWRTVATDGGSLLDVYRSAKRAGWTGQVAVQAVSFREVADAADLLARLQVESVVTRTDGAAAALVRSAADRVRCVACWSVDNHQAGLIVSAEPATSKHWHQIRRAVSLSAPAVAPGSLSDEDLHRIANTLGAAGRVEVSKVAARGLFLHRSMNFGYPEQQANRPTMGEVIEELAGEATIRTLTLHIRDILALHLRKNAGATFYSGDFEFFHDQVVPHLTAAVVRRRRLLNNRERGAGGHTAPVDLRFAAGVFRTAEDTGRVLQAFRGIPGVDVAVLHRNPYFHAVVTDHTDGSNMDVLVTEDNCITIVPGFRASSGVLMRLTEQVGDALGIAEVREHQTVQLPSLSELFAPG